MVRVAIMARMEMAMTQATTLSRKEMMFQVKKTVQVGMRKTATMMTQVEKRLRRETRIVCGQVKKTRMISES